MKFFSLSIAFITSLSYATLVTGDFEGIDSLKIRAVSAKIKIHDKPFVQVVYDDKKVTISKCSQYGSRFQSLTIKESTRHSSISVDASSSLEPRNPGASREIGEPLPLEVYLPRQETLEWMTFEEPLKKENAQPWEIEETYGKLCLTSKGSGGFHIGQHRGGDINATISGSGSISFDAIKASTSSLIVNLKGSGHLKVSDGEVDLLETYVSGIGEVYYRGIFKKFEELLRRIVAKPIEIVETEGEVTGEFQQKLIQEIVVKGASADQFNSGTLHISGVNLYSGQTYVFASSPTDRKKNASH